MKATFVELPPFERYRKNYLDDQAFSVLQQELMQSPLAGDVIIGLELFIIGGMAARSFGYSLSTTKMNWQI